MPRHEECCLTCKHMKLEGDDYYMCDCEDSDFFGLEAMPDEYCDEYVSKYEK